MTGAVGARKRAVLAVVLAVLALAGCGGGGVPEGEVVRFTVPPGSGMNAVSDTLVNRGLVGNRPVFRLYARFTGAARSIKPGIYEVEGGTSWGDILAKLQAGDVIRLSVVVPEGWTSMQIAQRIAAATQTPPDSVLALVADSAVAAEFGAPGPTLEGYLYPATYVFAAGTPPRDMLRTMFRRYQQAWTPELRARAEEIGLSEREVVTLASIVEKEARRWTERDTIAGVFHNRLRINMPLQADPTVQYALGEHQSRLLYSHIDDVADHPYNTYRRRGLPPGPIASPSEGAIRAALYPADVNFLYFVARPDGSHVFTRTLAEHNRARIEVRRMQQQGATAPAAPGGR